MITWIKRLISKYKKAIQYVIFAVATSLLHVAVFFVSHSFITENLIICNVVAYFFSIVTSFIINRNVVFKPGGGNPVLQMLKYLLVKLSSFIIDSLLLLLLNNVLLMPTFWAKLISNCSTTLNNYFLNNRFVFPQKKTQSREIKTQE